MGKLVFVHAFAMEFRKQRQYCVQAKPEEDQERSAAELEGNWQAGAPAVFQPFEASNPRNTSGHHINVVLKPGASQVLPFDLA